MRRASHMTLYTKCIHLPPEKTDGLRISVMSRHTLNDGKTPDARIIPTITFDQWLRFVAPPDDLVGAYYKKRVSWGEYAQLYSDFIGQPDRAVVVRNVARQSLQQDITLLCVEKKPDFCHRRLLAEECKRLEPRVEIVHKLP